MSDQRIQLVLTANSTAAVAGVNNLNLSIRMLGNEAATTGRKHEKAYDGMLAGVKKYADGIKAAGAEMIRLGEKGYDKIKDGAKTVGMGVAIAAPFALAAKNAADFYKGVAEVSTLIKDKSLQDVEKEFGPMILGVAKAYGQQAGVVTKAAYQAISAGVAPTAEDVRNLLEISGKAAIGGVSDVETAVDGLTSVVNAYGKEVIGYQQTADMMFQSVVAGKTTFGELSASLFQVIPVAAANKVSFANVTAAIATMTAQGTPTTVATTQLRQMIVELSKSNMDAAKTFKRLTGQSFPDFMKGGGTVADALAVMERHATRNRMKMGDMFSSVEAGSAALQLTGAGTAVFARNLDGAANSAGMADAAFGKMAESTAFKFDQMKQSFSNAAITLGTSLLPLVERVVPVMTQFADKIALMIQQDPTFVSGLLDAAGGVMQLVIAIGLVKIAIGAAYFAVAAFKGLVAAWRVITLLAAGAQAIWNLSLWVGFLPVIAILVVAVGALGLVIWALWKPIKFVWEKISALFSTAGKLMGLFGGDTTMTTKVMTEPAAAPSAPASTASNGILGNITSAIPQMPAIPSAPQNAAIPMEGGTTEVRIDYHPQVTISGGSAADRESFKKLLDSHKDDIAKMVADVNRRRGTLDYAGAK